MTAQERSIATKKSLFWRMHHALDAPCYRVMAKPREEWNQGKDKNYGRDKKHLAEGGIVVPNRKGEPEKFFTAEEVAELIPTLEAKNKRGFDIYICPDPRDDAEYHYIVLDDLPDDRAEQVAASGYAPCLRQRSSADNQQVILKVKKERPSGFEQSAANELMQTLNMQFGGDAKISGARHLFRMPGFLNRKPERRKDDGSFWVSELLDTRRSIESAKAAAELSAIRQRRREEGKIGRWVGGDEETAADIAARTEAVQRAAVFDDRGQAAVERVFCRAWAKHAGLGAKMAEEGTWKKIDRSAVDFRVCVEMLTAGYTEGSIESALSRYSPAVPDRWNPQDYTRRTVKNAAGRVARDAMRGAVAGITEEIQNYDDGR